MSLEIKNISKSFGGFSALDSVSLRMSEKALVGLIGPNGAGKSTLFAIISGFQRQTAGEVSFLGKSIDTLSPEERARRGAVRTFQVPRPFHKLTVRENLAAAAPDNPGESLLPLFIGWGRIKAAEQRISERVEQVMDFLKLRKVAANPAGQLSGGQKKLLELGRALMTNPKLLLLDEPFAGVNPVLIEEISQRIRQLHQMGVGCLIIEHNLPALSGLVPHVYAMDRGKIIAEGTPGDVLKDPLVRSAYLGEG